MTLYLMSVVVDCVVKKEESKNLQIVAQYFTEYWGKANPNIVDDLCADDFTMNYPMHGIRHGKSSTKNMLTDLKRTGEEGALMALQNLGLLAQPSPGKEVQLLYDI
ncbi:hypothetical protein TrVGV298_006970 [Trichoderma virens]|nr:hypothetical protein TrVGV298_006970 [Trichoderma virens]